MLKFKFSYGQSLPPYDGVPPSSQGEKSLNPSPPPPLGDLSTSHEELITIYEDGEGGDTRPKFLRVCPVGEHVSRAKITPHKPDLTHIVHARRYFECVRGDGCTQDSVLAPSTVSEKSDEGRIRGYLESGRAFL